MCKTYHIIGGKLSKRADAMLADFRKVGKWTWKDLKNNDLQSASVEFEGQKYEVSYSTEDAKRAGLLPAKAGSGWAKYPANMLRARLISETLRAIAPEIVQGAYTPEEISDFDEPKNVTPAKVAPKAQPKPEPKQEPITVQAVEVVDALPFMVSEFTERKLIEHEEKVNAYLREKGKVDQGETWRHCSDEYLKQIDGHLERFLKAVGIESETTN
jgi:hypothetical protein